MMTIRQTPGYIPCSSSPLAFCRWSWLCVRPPRSQPLSGASFNQVRATKATTSSSLCRPQQAWIIRSRVKCRACYFCYSAIRHRSESQKSRNTRELPTASSAYGSAERTIRQASGLCSPLISAPPSTRSNQRSCSNVSKYARILAVWLRMQLGPN